MKLYYSPAPFLAPNRQTLTIADAYAYAVLNWTSDSQHRSEPLAQTCGFP